MHLLRSLMLAGLVTAATSTQAVVFTSAFDGGWYDPEHPGQGFTFEQVTGPGGRPELLVYFSTFDVDGTPTLLVGQTVTSGAVAEMVLNRPVIMGSGASGVYPAPQLIPSGTLRLEMTSCAAGKADFVVQPRPGAVPATLSKIRVGTGSLRLQRLYNTTGEAKRCSGGISDDTLPGQQPVSFEKFYLGSFVDARVTYERRSDRAELNFDLRSLPIGSYSLLVDDRQVATFNATPFRTTTRAQVKFTSPITEGARLLDFDPLDRIVKVSMIGNNSVSDLFRTPQGAVVLDTQPVFVGTAVGNTAVTTQSFNNREVGGFGVRTQENFLLEAQLKETGNAVELILTVENAEPGYYDIMVDSRRRGTVYVLPQNSGINYGRIRFRKPVEAGAFPLDFEPRNAELLFIRENNIDFTAIILQD